MKRKKRKADIDISEIDTLNLDLLRRFLSGDGKSARIVSRYMTGLPARYQRKLTKAVKRARQLNLI